MRVSWVTILFFLSLFGIASAAAGPRIEAGEWEFKMKMDMPGMPANMPAMSYKSCMQQDNPVPPQAQKDNASADCDVKHQKMSGDTAEWTVRCTDKDMVSETKGKGTYRGNTMEAKQTTTMTKAGGAPQTMTHNMTGKRVGPCKQSN